MHQAPVSVLVWHTAEGPKVFGARINCLKHHFSMDRARNAGLGMIQRTAQSRSPTCAFTAELMFQ